MNKLKKILTIVFTAFLAITLAACGLQAQTITAVERKKK